MCLTSYNYTGCINVVEELINVTQEFPQIRTFFVKKTKSWPYSVTFDVSSCFNLYGDKQHVTLVYNHGNGATRTGSNDHIRKACRVQCFNRETFSTNIYLILSLLIYQNLCTSCPFLIWSLLPVVVALLQWSLISVTFCLFPLHCNSVYLSLSFVLALSEF